MGRRSAAASGAPWTSGTPGPGAVSLLTRAVASHWVWPDDIEVVHVYLTADVLARACRDMYDRYVSDVSLRDEVQADDPAIHRTALMLAQEAALGGPGCGLLVDALACQLAVLLVRAHADVVFDEPAGAGLTSAQERAVRDHVEEHLHERITLDDLGDRRGTEPLPVPAAVPAIDRDEPARLRARPAGGARRCSRAGRECRFRACG